VSAVFLRHLARILHYVPAVHGVDSGHVDACNDAADEFETLEQKIRDGDRAQIKLVVDRDRLIYHLLRLCEGYPYPDYEAFNVAGLCLEQFGYALHSNRAIRMLDLGEPGRSGSVESGPSEPPSDLELLISLELQRRLSRHVGKLLTPRRIKELKAEAQECVTEIAEQYTSESVPPFELEPDPNDPSRVVVVWKERF
jgi:hypothetical protein